MSVLQIAKNAFTLARIIKDPVLKMSNFPSSWERSHSAENAERRPFTFAKRAKTF